MKNALLMSATLLLLAPIVAWSMYKPVRVFAPELVGNVSCVNQNICVDDESKYPEAFKLYENALSFVARAAGPFKKKPRIIFCSTVACFEGFGFNKASATTVGRSGIVISPKGWRDHYVRHEMFHHRQAEELGMLASLLYPEWFIEGMAYSLSDDPRRTLSERWQYDRARFDDWYEKVGNNRLWEEAGKL